ncbi:MAG: hypothetical protein K6A05_01660 [Lachnospiraceae bacterium]|nr:hypothetical protein [Lachnospiraceae bacterium]
MSQFTMENYGKKSTFASFLPGIAGIHGIPIWCYYVNRGQGVVSFGVENKDHSIMEFYPAHTAYQNVKRTGFRTFLHVDGEYREAFADEDVPHAMDIEMNTLTVRSGRSLVTEATYFILPEERLGALVRKVTFTNTASHPVSLVYADGMPALIPYGVSLESMKNMAQLSKAWMQVEDLERRVPRFGVRASMEDTASVTEIEGSNFALAVDSSGQLQQVMVDNDILFAYDSSLQQAVGFREQGLGVLEQKQNTSNLIPGCFFLGECTLAPGESKTIYELYGQVEKTSQLEDFLSGHTLDAAYFEDKLGRARMLTEELVACIETHTGSKTFDAYTAYTYMDNVLRGGLPIPLGEDKTFYVYSRKHGDLEREYNFFSMSPEYYSQGNGNFRDVNQNRRCDIFFHPKTGRDSIHMFYDLIQLDGYNPLSVEKKVYTYEGRTFTPGQLYLELLEKQPDEASADAEFYRIMTAAKENVGANFGEGYWCDHWTYNLDLIEDYLSMYPEEETDLLTEQRYTYFLSQAKVNPRAARYEKTPQGIRQYHALDEKSKRNTQEKQVRTGFGHGTIYQGTLLEKLLLLSAVKFATLDPYGMGIEMEGGKPGWYDALNGLPGILGSSMAETYELQRMMHYLGHGLGLVEIVPVFAELAELLQTLHGIVQANRTTILGGERLALVDFWNAINDAKEAYREATYDGIRGEVVEMDAVALRSMMEDFVAITTAGIEKAMRLGNGLAPTYFYYEVTGYEEAEDGIHPKEFLLHMVPAFLEGPVRYLKLPLDSQKKRGLYQKVKSSNLYDKKLAMYKVNESLAGASYEIGRCKCFTPGWLENESIWLHMEYKYLLELLRSGLYAEFAEDFHKACVAFMDPEVYGRSVLENSSFIASSANPNTSIHGKGFVARLSGSTIEFISMWKMMMFGKQPFHQAEELCFQPNPLIPEYLIPEDGVVGAKFGGRMMVYYHCEIKKDYLPGEYRISSMETEDMEGVRHSYCGDTLIGEDARSIRDGRVVRLDVFLQ